MSDLRARDYLRDADRCHQLHFLQMAVEKVCKAYFVALNGFERLEMKHGYIGFVLPMMARSAESFGGMGPFKRWQLNAIKRIAQELDLLAPANRAGDTRHDNAEYPWMTASGSVQTPCTYSFHRLNEEDRAFVSAIHLIRNAAMHYATPLHPDANLKD